MHAERTSGACPRAGVGSQEGAGAPIACARRANETNETTPQVHLLRGPFVDSVCEGGDLNPHANYGASTSS